MLAYQKIFTLVSSVVGIFEVLVFAAYMDLLSLKKKINQTNNKLQVFLHFSVSLPCFCTYSGKEQYIEIIVSFFTNCGFLISEVPKLLRAQSFVLQ